MSGKSPCNFWRAFQIVKTLNRVALFIYKPITITRHNPVAARRNNSLYTLPPGWPGRTHRCHSPCPPSRASVPACVSCNNAPACPKIQWIAEGISNGVNIGSKTTFRTSQGLGFRTTSCYSCSTGMCMCMDDYAIDHYLLLIRMATITLM